MATWVVHMKIAQRLLEIGAVPQSCQEEFITGSLSPDCGYGSKDSTNGFTPPAEVTHFAKNGKKTDCRYDEFYDTYVKNKEKNPDYYFYLGYFVHLATDVFWAKNIFEPAAEKYTDAEKKDLSYIAEIKKDWCNLDFKFLRENPDFKPYTVLKNITSVKDYLPYYEQGQLTVQLKYIADYYKTIPETNYTNEILQQKINNFITDTTDFVIKYITQKNEYR